jgi:hypothetical protein
MSSPHKVIAKLLWKGTWKSEQSQMSNELLLDDERSEFICGRGTQTTFQLNDKKISKQHFRLSKATSDAQHQTPQFSIEDLRYSETTHPIHSTTNIKARI